MRQIQPLRRNRMDLFLESYDIQGFTSRIGSPKLQIIYLHFSKSLDAKKNQVMRTLRLLITLLFSENSKIC